MNEPAKKVPSPEERPDLYDDYDGLPEGRKTTVKISSELERRIAEDARNEPAKKSPGPEERPDLYDYYDGLPEGFDVTTTLPPEWDKFSKQGSSNNERSSKESPKP